MKCPSMILKEYVNICIMIRSENNNYDKTSKLLLKTKENNLLTTTQRIRCKQEFLLGIKSQQYTNTFHYQSGFLCIVDYVQVMKCFLVALFYNLLILGVLLFQFSIANYFDLFLFYVATSLHSLRLHNIMQKNLSKPQDVFLVQ